MKNVNLLLDAVRNLVRRYMRLIATGLNLMSGGRLHPSVVTIIGLLAHVPIAWLISTTHYSMLAAILLIVFGLFDTLDGELARLQKRASNAGMLLDATTDRMKEVILYMGVVVALYRYAEVSDSSLEYALLAVVAACGGSLLVSYVKAKGETAVKDLGLTANQINRLFQDGLVRFEIRMFLLVLGLAANRPGALLTAVALIAIGSWITAVERMVKISRRLNA